MAACLRGLASLQSTLLYPWPVVMAAAAGCCGDVVDVRTQLHQGALVFPGKGQQPYCTWITAQGCGQESSGRAAGTD